MKPVPLHLGVKRLQCPHIRRHSMVGIEAAHHAAEPPALLGDGLMPAPPEVPFDLPQLRSHPWRYRAPDEEKLPRPRLPADVRETEEVEGLRLAEIPLSATLGRIATELNETGLLGMQFHRMNHYVNRSERGTRTAALFYSLIESAKLCRVEPRAYLREATLRAVRNPGTVTLARDLKSSES